MSLQRDSALGGVPLRHGQYAQRCHHAGLI